MNTLKHSNKHQTCRRPKKLYCCKLFKINDKEGEANLKQIYITWEVCFRINNIKINAVYLVLTGGKSIANQHFWLRYKNYNMKLSS